MCWAQGRHRACGTWCAHLAGLTQRRQHTTQHTHGVRGSLGLVEGRELLSAVGAGCRGEVCLGVFRAAADRVLGGAVLARARDHGVNGVCGAGAGGLAKHGVRQAGPH